MGDSGVGKTSAAATFLQVPDIDLYHIGTEPGACEVLVDACKRLGVSMEHLHFHQLKVAAPGWDALFEMADKVKSMNYSQLADLKEIGKQKMAHWMAMLHQLKNFHCDRTGKDYGDVTSFGPTSALVIDSLSGLNKMAREYVVGYKPSMHQGEWGTAMSLEENLIYKLTTDRACFFVLIAHIDRETDEVFGGTKLTLSALGRKLAPQLVKYFSEIPMAKKDGDKFFWSTKESSQIITKNRILAIDDKLPPSFVPIVTGYRERVKALAAST